MLLSFFLKYLSLYCFFVVNVFVIASQVVYCLGFLQLLQVFGIVNSTVDFKSQHLVVDGCSDVLMEVFGKPVGYHARSAIGTSTLPLDMTVEVEAIIQIKP